MSQVRSILLLDDSDNQNLNTVIRIATELGLEYYPYSYELGNIKCQVTDWVQFLLDKHPYICINLHLGESGGSSHFLLYEEVDEICQFLQEHQKIKEICNEKFIEKYQKFCGYDLHKKYKLAFWMVYIAEVYKLKISLIVIKGRDHTFETSLVDLLDDPEKLTHRFDKNNNPFNYDNLRKVILPPPPLRKSITLKEFLTKTETVNWHGISKKENGFNDLSDLIGLDVTDRSFLDSLPDKGTLIEECLKHLSGIDACVHGNGSNCLALFGSFFILLGVINRKDIQFASKVKPEIIYVSEFATSHNGFGYLLNPVLPLQSQKIAKLSMMLLERLFQEIVIHKKTKELMISSIKLCDKGMTITLDGLNIFGRSDKTTGETILQLLNNAYIKSIPFNILVERFPDLFEVSDIPETNSMTTGEFSIIFNTFNWLANGQDRRLDLMSTNEIFPKDNGIKIYPSTDGTKTILRLKVCHI
ncbi:hypothetical protein [Pseudanabaena sp. UWO310]|uniref:hypothetical protein n=1 Tax=Pseudanabaena sp. UWO310 TaxID=2480795 RepID=UPI0011587081|nr:hypothetical protein [Pseudanabaena sp. UWO310]TYQ30500.1 hypothetical protein PseudUWO310_08240 [Pseudanabaena sp. UWO310]